MKMDSMFQTKWITMFSYHWFFW